ncbi:hypothetical protein FNU76_06165 [Chitinimonas arctica]|uniref:Stress-induced protein n=1 Tax=Chitinimonas arctica TaxID=2594795 RepID=A0A516SCU2_9NEIS|nr:KGG domain-containing protein [Chitinimonas arctica]QDQ25973.1 hypothetical protein FNU76_06165 [Chitinimonas arctica]
MTSDTSNGTSKRGFASMDENKQREIASKGGQAAHSKGTAHEFDSAEAREAGRKGGAAVSANRSHMADIGRKGGQRRGAAKQKLADTKSANDKSGAIHVDDTAKRGRLDKQGRSDN